MVTTKELILNLKPKWRTHDETGDEIKRSGGTYSHQTIARCNRTLQEESKLEQKMITIKIEGKTKRFAKFRKI